MNWNELATQVKILTGRNDSAFDTRISEALNRGLREWGRVRPWESLKKVDTIVHNGGRHLVLPADVERLIWIMDATNSYPIEASDRQWDRDAPYDYAQDVTGRATQWEPDGYVPTLTGVSSYVELRYTASDNMTVYLQGWALAAGGTAPRDLYRVGESLNVTGTSPVTSANQYFSLTSVSKSTDVSGLLSVLSQGTVVGRADQYEREARYQRIKFMKIPTAGTTFKYEYYAKTADRTGTAATPDPAVDEDFLVWFAASEIFMILREGTRATAAKRRAQEIADAVRAKDQMWGDFGARIIPGDYT